MQPLDSTNKVVSRYFLFAVAVGLLLPEIGLAQQLGIDPSSIPIYAWIAGIDGALTFYPDYFLIMAAALPFWLFLFGRVYAQHYSSHGVSLPILLPIALIGLLAVGAIVSARVDPLGNDAIQRWETMLIVAARSRLIGALLFGGIHYFVFGLLSVSLVKTPIDVARRVTSRT